ncbi:hypothetical protein [Paenibacillus ottowii]
MVVRVGNASLFEIMMQVREVGAGHFARFGGDGGGTLQKESRAYRSKEAYDMESPLILKGASVKLT